MGIERFPSRGVLSARSIITFVLAAFTTVLLWTILASTTVGAADATWNGASLIHDNRNYYLTGTAKAGNPAGVPVDSMYYVANEIPPGTPTGSTHQKAYIIYLAPGVSPPSDGKATFVSFDYDTRTKAFTNSSGTKAITIDVNSITMQATTCSIQSVGWIVCPTMNFLAWGMDQVFTLIANFMEVQPLQTGNSQGALYNAWNAMRNIANVAFIIFFMIIIYSQLTSVSVGNYGIKKLLPRLIIAAIAINLSYFICAIAVDVSNILGFSIHQMFTDFRNQLMSTGITDPAATANLGSWESVTGFVLSGGTAVAAGLVGLHGLTLATQASITSAIFLLLPALVGLLMTVLVVLLILAARQAIIIIFIIIAPLALVAYLLPNTEKWFSKWRGVLMTMLIFFPAFSVVFGGSQLAGAVIIQNASSLNMLILGMIVQVAPLVITPLILRFSGNLLGSIARLVNNPNKGAIDRTRNWAKGHADWHAARGRGNLDRKGNPLRDKKTGEFRKTMNPARRYAQYMDQRGRRRKDRTANGEMAAQSGYEASNLYSNSRYDMSEQKATFEAQRDTIHSNHAAHVDKARRTPGSLIYQPAITAQAAKERAETQQNNTSEFYNRVRSDRGLASRVGAGALYSSSYNLENSKLVNENSETLKTAYYNTQRATTGTVLNTTSRTLETTKLNAETAQNTYTTAMEQLKANPATSISLAARNAQSSKEHLEVAQNQLQAFFDTERKTVGTSLNRSNINLEESKSIAEKAKSQLTEYVVSEKSRKDGSLRKVTFEAEQAKLSQQIGETRLSSLIEELRSGKIADADLASPAEKLLMQDMQAQTVRLAAEKRRGDSAQYTVQRTFAEVMTGADTSTPAAIALTEEMRTIAQGVGGDTARVRAISNAVATARGLDNDALKANVDLLRDEAQRKGTNIKHYSNSIVKAVLEDKSVMPDGTTLTPERIKAALQAQAEEKNVPLFEDVIGSAYFDQSMVKEIISLNSGPFKGAGAFAMQDQLKTIDDFSTEEDFKHQLSLDHISNLANANATGIAGWKMGEVVRVSQTLDTDISAALLEIKNGTNPDGTETEDATNARNSLKAAYKTVRDALTNPDIVATMNDREGFVRSIEKKLAILHGQNPVEDTEVELKFDADTFSSNIYPDEPASDDASSEA